MNMLMLKLPHIVCQQHFANRRTKKMAVLADRLHGEGQIAFNRLGSSPRPSQSPSICSCKTPLKTGAQAPDPEFPSIPNGLQLAFTEILFCADQPFTLIIACDFHDPPNRHHAYRQLAPS